VKDPELTAAILLSPKKRERFFEGKTPKQRLIAFLKYLDAAPWYQKMISAEAEAQDVIDGQILLDVATAAVFPKVNWDWEVTWLTDEKGFRTILQFTAEWYVGKIGKKAVGVLKDHQITVTLGKS
jgi:hypothetical protein